MRKISAGLFISLDGVVEAPETWTGPFFNEEVGQTVGSLIAGGDTLLLGRVTYEGFAESFGGDTGGMADTMNAFPKVVVSTTLEEATWQNSTLIKDNVAEEITKLKQQKGGTINMSGSGTLVAWLLRQGLLDQLDLLVFPVVVGHGKRLLEGEGATVPLTLGGSTTFSNGVLHLTYRPVTERSGSPRRRWSEQVTSQENRNRSSNVGMPHTSLYCGLPLPAEQNRPRESRGTLAPRGSMREWPSAI